MAVYNGLQMSQVLSGADNDRKIQSYLFQNNELLRYMFNNLNPEDNYSDQALQKYYENNEKIVSMEVSIEGLNLGLKNLRTETETNFKVMDGLIQLKVSKGDVSNQISIEKDQVYIGGNRLVIESTNLKLDANGNATFSGKITGATVRVGKNWDVSSDTCYMLYADDENLNLGNFHVIEYGGRYIIESDDSWVGMSPEVSKKTGRVSLWANYNPSTGGYAFSVSQSGNTRISKLYAEEIGDSTEWSGYSLGEALDAIWTGHSWSLERLKSEIEDLWDAVSE